MVKKIDRPLRKGVKTKHSDHVFSGKVGPTAAMMIFMDVGQGPRQRVHQTSPGPEAQAGLGLSILRAPPEIPSLLIKETTWVPGRS